MSSPAKATVRREARDRRRRLALELDRAAAEEAITSAVLALVPGRARVAVYESLPDEPPTGRLIAALLDAGHEVIVPVTLADWSLQWRYAVHGAVADPATIARHPASQPAHPASGDDSRPWLGARTLATCDLVLTPGLSVDRHGTRLGKGGGSYDRALVHRNPSAPVLTLLHDGERSDRDLPRDAHDVPVDGWVTTSGQVHLIARDGPRN